MSPTKRTASLALGLSLQINGCGDDALQNPGGVGDAGQGNGGAPDGSAGSSSGAGDVGNEAGSGIGQPQAGGGGTETQGGASPTGAGGDATATLGGASGGDGGGSEPGCPVQAPADGGPCEAASDLTCGYGTDPRPNCRALFQCTAGAWALVSDGVCDGSSQDCPADPANPDANVCSNLGISCIYPASHQACDCRGQNVDLTWWCSESPGPDCPVPSPNYGTTCDTPVTCRYKTVFCTVWELECVDGRWLFNGSGNTETCDP